MQIDILLLAGGASSRMLGRDKLLEPVRDSCLLRDRAQMCLATAARQVIAVIAPDKPERRQVLADLDIQIVENGGSFQGLSHSLQVGLKQVRTEAVLILLADLPDLDATDLDAVTKHAASSDALVIRGASADGRAGHPVVIRAALFDDLARLSGDTGAQPILAQYGDQTELVALPGDHAVSDLDTPEAWETWHSLSK